MCNIPSVPPDEHDVLSDVKEPPCLLPPHELFKVVNVVYHPGDLFICHFQSDKNIKQLFKIVSK